MSKKKLSMDKRIFLISVILTGVFLLVFIVSYIACFIVGIGTSVYPETKKDLDTLIYVNIFSTISFLISFIASVVSFFKISKKDKNKIK